MQPIGLTEYYQTTEAYADYLRALDKREYESYVDLFARFVAPADGPVVDVGCGVGSSTMMLRARGLAATGTDISELFLPSGEPGFEVVDFTDARTIPDGAFAAAGCHDVIEHIEQPRQFLAELVRVVRPGGHIIIHAPNLTSPIVALRVVLDNLHQGRTPYLGIDSLSEAVRLVAANVWHSLRGMWGVMAFRGRAPRLETGIITYDVDAVYWTNPAEIRRFLEARGCEIRWYQQEGRSWPAKLIARFAPDFAGRIAIVARKR